MIIFKTKRVRAMGDAELANHIISKNPKIKKRDMYNIIQDFGRNMDSVRGTLEGNHYSTFPTYPALSGWLKKAGQKPLNYNNETKQEAREFIYHKSSAAEKKVLTMSANGEEFDTLFENMPNATVTAVEINKSVFGKLKKVAQNFNVTAVLGDFFSKIEQLPKQDLINVDYTGYLSKGKIMHLNVLNNSKAKEIAITIQNHKKGLRNKKTAWSLEEEGSVRGTDNVTRDIIKKYMSNYKLKATNEYTSSKTPMITMRLRKI